MGRLDLPDPRRDEDSSVDSTPTSEALGAEKRSLTDLCMCFAYDADDDYQTFWWRPCPEELCERADHRHA